MTTAYIKNNENWYLNSAGDLPDEYVLSNGLVNKIVELKAPKKKDLYVNCECNSEILRITKWEDEDEFYLIDYEDEYSVIIDSLLNEVFNKSQKDMFDWFCYESDFGEKEDFHAYDKNGNIICDTWENLYKTLEEYEIEF